MDVSGTYQYQLQVRRLRLIENMLDDYQSNIRHALQLINSERISSMTEVPYNRSRRANLFSAENNTIPQNDAHMNYINPAFQNTYAFGVIELDNQQGLTAGQIANETEMVIYDASMGSERCPITWDAFEENQIVMRINRCGHIFGEPALRNWLQTHSSCPVCRIHLHGTYGNAYINASRVRGNAAAQSLHSNASNTNDMMVQLIRYLMTGTENSESSQ
jgi:hypothetical protein